MGVLGSVEETIATVCCVAVPGAAIRGPVVLLIAVGILLVLATMLSAYRLCLFSREYSQPSELADGNLPSVFWESRPAPAMGTTLSKNKTEPDGLVGLPKTCPVYPHTGGK